MSPRLDADAEPAHAATDMTAPTHQDTKPEAWWRKIPELGEKVLRPWVIALSVSGAVVLGPLLAFSESTLRSILDRWLSQCVVVIEVEEPSEEAPMVRIYMFGHPPPSLPLTFSANRGVIDRVSLINHVEQDLGRGEISLLVHPLANQRCPGDLCPEQTGSAEKLTVRLAPVETAYSFRFRVLTSMSLPAEQLRVYSRPRQGDSMTCRVEKASAINYLARQSPGIQATLLFLVVAMLTLVLGFIRRGSGDGK